MKNFILIFITIFLFWNCNSNQQNNTQTIIYNLIEHENGIYKITESNVLEIEIVDKSHEIVYLNEDKKVRIERKDKNGKLSDGFSVPAITMLEYNSKDQVASIKYLDYKQNKAAHQLFGYHIVEYIYDELNRVKAEFYKDENSNLLEIPKDSSGDYTVNNFIAPILTYEYLENGIRIKAFDKNFNLLKEVIGDKPCIPFIDCGEGENEKN